MRANIESMRKGKAAVAKIKQHLHPGMMVKVIKAPKEVPYLQGKVGMLVYRQALTCVKIGDNFTHFRYNEIEIVKSK